MAYKALYRKYRPSNFDEVVGQQHIVKTLQNAIENNKLAHAYLFCGPRGTGKTSIAKLLAKTINCTAKKKPCCKCDNCLQIQEGSHPDVVELDAATNNGVDEVRELIEKVKYSPMQGKYKVYIIDEVHMMTNNAFNALLKTLEEPPEYCIFVLATTEPHKVLPTIISRCQRFDFNKIPTNVIEGHLKNICKKEKISISDDALRLIAEIADGGMRDALSVLDQCIAYSQDNITVEDVGAVYGVTTVSEKIELIKQIKKRDTSELMNMINSISNRGIDLKRLTIELIDIFKEAVVYSYSKDSSLLKHLEVSQALSLLDDFRTGELLRFIEYLMEAQSRYPLANNAQVYFEVAMLNMIETPSEEKVIERMVIEKAAEPVKEPKKEPAPKPARIPVAEIRNYSDEQLYQMLKVSTKAIKEADSENFTKMQNCDEMEYLARAGLIKGSVVFADSEKDIIIVVKDRSLANSINEADNEKIYGEMTEKYLGTRKNVVAITDEMKNHITTYFRARRENEAREIEEKQAQPEAESENDLAALEKLFGKDGFDIVS
ncbi:MAG: DNA polymerase III subunit gamma/tau [Erysipelotrichaceae bacterium]|nr:DNA polymerase III subunit gamma/tau [Erysipelotrichaceae bacterium]